MPLFQKNFFLARIFHGNSAAACESLVDTTSVSHCSSGGMRHTAVVAMHRLPCLHQAARRLATNHHKICGLALGLIVLLFSSCASYDHRLNDPSTRYLGFNGSLTSQERKAFCDRISYWDGGNIPGAPSITIDLSDQRLYYYKGNKLVAVSAVSTGCEGRETKIGHYKITKKDLHHVSSECGDYVNNEGIVVVKNVVTKEVPKPAGTHFVGSPMPYYMMIYPGVGMHTGFLPGVPDSHGCIRLPDNMAKTFFEVTPIGTPVTVQR